MWEDGRPTQEYCSKIAVPGKPYCKAHAKRAYRDPDRRRVSDRPHRVPQETVDTIMVMKGSGRNSTEIGKMFGLSPGHVRSIISREKKRAQD